MEVADFLDVENVFVTFPASSKKQVLSDLCEKAAVKTNIDCHIILDQLLSREKLGATSLGNSIAIPHGKIPGLTKLTAFVAKLEKPIDFDAEDKNPIDFIFLLLAPEDAAADHLKVLSKIARLFKQHNLITNIQSANDTKSLYTHLTEIPQTNAA